MREIKFRAWDSERQTMENKSALAFSKYGVVLYDYEQLMQYTGFKDKNEVEIYEHMELDNQFEVSFNQGSYILTNISNGDIMTLHKYIKDKNGQVKITREYTKI